jgi:hypothetical protein
MHKRGTTLVLKPLFEIALALFFVASAFSIAKGMGTQEYFVQARIARDGALLVDTFASVPGNGWMRFPSDVSEYDIHLERSTFSLAAEPGPIKHSFFGTNGIIPRTTTDVSTIVYKNGANISLAEHPKLLSQLDCDYSDIRQFQTIRMDITGGMEPLATALRLSCREGHCARGEGSEDIFIKVVPLTRGSIPTNGITARFYYDAKYVKESRELGCQFLNSAMMRNPELNIWLLPTADSTLGTHKNIIGLLIEVGPNDIVRAAEALQSVVQ